MDGDCESFRFTYFSKIKYDKLLVLGLRILNIWDLNENKCIRVFESGDIFYYSKYLSNGNLVTCDRYKIKVWNLNKIME